jgi:hypothetical protein
VVFAEVGCALFISGSANGNRLNYRNEPESRLFNFYLLEDSSNAKV